MAEKPICLSCLHPSCTCFCHFYGNEKGLPCGFFYKPKDDYLVTTFLTPALENRSAADPLLRKYVHFLNFFHATANDLAAKQYITAGNWIFLSPRKRTKMDAADPDRRVTNGNQTVGQWRVAKNKLPLSIISNGVRVADKTILRFYDQQKQPTQYYASEFVPMNSKRVEANADLVMEETVLYHMFLLGEGHI